MARRSRAEAEAILHNALTRLSSARREKLSREDYDVFADGLIGCDCDVVARVCEELGREAPGEYEPRFPPLHIILERVRLVLRHQRERAEQQRLLTRAVTPPVAPEKLAAFMAQLRAVTRKKGFPR